VDQPGAEKKSYIREAEKRMGRETGKGGLPRKVKTLHKKEGRGALGGHIPGLRE